MSWPRFRITSGATYSNRIERIYLFINEIVIDHQIFTRRPAKSPSFKVTSTLKLLCESKIHQFYVSGYVEQKIFWLKISANLKSVNNDKKNPNRRIKKPVDDVSRMQIVEGFNNARCVKSSGCIIKMSTVS